MSLIIENTYGANTLLLVDYITVDKSLAVSNTNAAAINLYPNPTRGAINIQAAQGNYLKVLNSSGTCISSQLVGQYTLSIDLSSQPSGMYILHFSKGLEQYIRRVIKQ